VIVLDSNLWVFGTLEANARAEQLLDEIETGATTSALSAYMLEEILSAFGRVPGLSGAERDQLVTTFCRRLSQMDGLIEAPSQRDVTDQLLEETRTATQTKLLSAVLGVEAKDVPILVLAYRHASREPTILTNDESFARLDLAEQGVSTVEIEYVS
jgi:predicted nucleic acid-binding protein